MIEHVIGEIQTAGRAGSRRAGRSSSRRGRREIRAVFSRPPRPRARLVRPDPAGRERAARHASGMIAVMRAGGLSDQVIGLACDLLPLYVMAFCYEESLYGERDLTRGDGDSS